MRGFFELIIRLVLFHLLKTHGSRLLAQKNDSCSASLTQAFSDEEIAVGLVFADDMVFQPAA